MSIILLQIENLGITFVPDIFEWTTIQIVIIVTAMILHLYKVEFAPF